MISGLDSLSTMNTTASMAQAKTQAQQEENKISEFSDIFESALASEDTSEVKEACVEFETYFLQLMMKEMRKTINTDDSYLQSSNAQQIYQESLDNELMEQVSQGGGVGLAESMYESLIRNGITTESTSTAE